MNSIRLFRSLRRSQELYDILVPYPRRWFIQGQPQSRLWRLGRFYVHNIQAGLRRARRGSQK